MRSILFAWKILPAGIPPITSALLRLTCVSGGSDTSTIPYSNPDNFLQVVLSARYILLVLFVGILMSFPCLLECYQPFTVWLYVFPISFQFRHSSIFPFDIYKKHFSGMGIFQYVFLFGIGRTPLRKGINATIRWPLLSGGLWEWFLSRTSITSPSKG